MFIAETICPTSLFSELGIAVGTEVLCRLSLVVPKAVHKAGFHPTAVFGAMGAAAGVGTALGLSARQIVDALGIAGSMAGGIIEYLAEGAWTKRLHAGWAAQSGIRAADPKDDGQVGMRATELRDDGLDRPYEIGFLVPCGGNQHIPASRSARAYTGTLVPFGTTSRIEQSLTAEARLVADVLSRQERNVAVSDLDAEADRILFAADIPGRSSVPTAAGSDCCCRSFPMRCSARCSSNSSSARATKASARAISARCSSRSNWTRSAAAC